MSETLQNRLRRELQLAVQSIHWTYSMFWKLCPQKEMLLWSDGYYNGAIKTRKTVQPTEVTTEEATFHRSEQLRELYESLTAGEATPKPRPPSSLSPENLTEWEWFYLTSISFSFPPGDGLPGKAYSKRRYVWLTGAGEVDVRVFSRSILAKSARIQTVLCLPVPDGVIELGTTQRVEEDVGLLKRIGSFFFLDTQNLNPPRQALSEHSSSSPPTSPLGLPAWPIASEEEEEEEEDEEDSGLTKTLNTFDATREQSETMEIALPEDIWQASPPLGVGVSDGFNSGLGLQSSYAVLAQEDAHYTQQLSNILKNQSHLSPKHAAGVPSTASAFSRWWSTSYHGHDVLHDHPSQKALKYVLYIASCLDNKAHDSTARTATPQDELLTNNHMLAERRRREKLNERFFALQSHLPVVTKMNKASILGSTIEYVKELQRRIQELESMHYNMVKNTCLKGQKRGHELGEGKRRTRAEEDGGRRKPKLLELTQQAVEAAVEVSIIENDALVEIKCLDRGELMLDLMHLLRELGIEVQTVQSSVCKGVFSASFRAKVKENVNGRKASIMEVKKSIDRIIDSSQSY